MRARVPARSSTSPTSFAPQPGDLFQGIEATGGAAEALVSGYIQRAVGGVRKEHEASIARGVESLTGATVFQNPAELPVTVLEAAKPEPAKPSANAIRIEPLAPIRLVEPFE